MRAVIDAGDAPTCTYTNTQNASLDIEKQSVGGTATFDFTGTGTNVPATFTRNTRPPTRRPARPFTFTGSELRTKMVTETPEPGWTSRTSSARATPPA